jgi:hypothetical protein
MRRWLFWLVIGAGILFPHLSVSFEVRNVEPPKIHKLLVIENVLQRIALVPHCNLVPRVARLNDLVLETLSAIQEERGDNPPYPPFMEIQIRVYDEVDVLRGESRLWCRDPALLAAS